MTNDEIVGAALSLHAWCIPVALGGLYAVYGDKFVRPMLERADSICATLRGKLTTELALTMKPFLPAGGHPVVANVSCILGQDGNPMDTATITDAVSIDSEEFKEAVTSFLDSESADVERYWRASDLRSKLRQHWNAIRWIVSVWPIFAVAATVVFWLLSKKVVPALPDSWLWAIAGIAMIPPFCALVRLPSLANVSFKLDQLEV